MRSNTGLPRHVKWDIFIPKLGKSAQYNLHVLQHQEMKAYQTCPLLLKNNTHICAYARTCVCTHTQANTETHVNVTDY